METNEIMENIDVVEVAEEIIVEPDYLKYGLVAGAVIGVIAGGFVLYKKFGKRKIAELKAIKEQKKYYPEAIIVDVDEDVE